MTTGCFITLEGGEGSGKTTLLEQLFNLLTQKGYQVVKTREPGGSKLGEVIRQWLLDPHLMVKIGAQAELLLFLAARAQHIEELIQPALNANKVVLCDRFNDSTIAYQGQARKLSSEYVQTLCELVCGPILPNLTLFLDLDPEIGIRRTKNLCKEQAASGLLDRIEAETMEFHKGVQKGLLSIASQEPQRMIRIDASLNQSKVLQQALDAIYTLPFFASL